MKNKDDDHRIECENCEDRVPATHRVSDEHGSMLLCDSCTHDAMTAYGRGETTATRQR